MDNIKFIFVTQMAAFRSCAAVSVSYIILLQRGRIACNAIPACEGRTDRQTDGIAVANTALCIASNAAAVLATAIPSVCLSVRPSHAGIVPRRMKIGSCGLYYEVAKTHWFLIPKLVGGAVLFHLKFAFDFDQCLLITPQR